jgi:hypothetical protein
MTFALHATDVLILRMLLTVYCLSVGTVVVLQQFGVCIGLLEMLERHARLFHKSKSKALKAVVQYSK